MQGQLCATSGSSKGALSGSTWREKTGAALTISNTTTAMSGNKYRCVVSDGTTTLTTNEATLTVTAAGSAGGGGGGGGVGGPTVSEYTLTFETNGGSKVSSVTKPSGTAVELSQYVTTRSGYDFVGWYSDAALSKAVTTVTLKQNTTVYAKWQESSSRILFTDVPEDAYYAEAVQWAAEKGRDERHGHKPVQPRSDLHPGPGCDLPVARHGQPGAHRDNVRVYGCYPRRLLR